MEKIWQGFRIIKETREQYIKRMTNSWERRGFTKESHKKDIENVPEKFLEDLHIDWTYVKVVQLKRQTVDTNHYIDLNGGVETNKKGNNAQWLRGEMTTYIANEWVVLIDGIEVYRANDLKEGYEYANKFHQECLQAWKASKKNN